MSSREVLTCICRAPQQLARRSTRHARHVLQPRATTTRCASSTPSSSSAPDGSVNQDLQDLESNSSLSASSPPAELPADYDPVKRAKARRTELPPSRYQFRSPRYYRGPLHPHQPPPTSDPASREFTPGPFNLPRLTQTYTSTIAPDLMALMFQHKPPGTIKTVKSDRLRSWDDTSPYHSGRPKRGPRGPGTGLGLLEPDINWLNIPRISAVTMHSFLKGAVSNRAHLQVGEMILQSVTGVKPNVHKAKKGVAQWGLRARMEVALTSKMMGDEAVEFVDKLVNLVMPRIKDYPGVNGTTGDSSGNLTIGLTPEAMLQFPEIQVNYDMYPPNMIPGCHITIHTTARSDRHARLLLKAVGVPFNGEYVD